MGWAWAPESSTLNPAHGQDVPSSVWGLAPGLGGACSGYIQGGLSLQCGGGWSGAPHLPGAVTHQVLTG